MDRMAPHVVGQGDSLRKHPWQYASGGYQCARDQAVFGLAGPRDVHVCSHSDAVYVARCVAHTLLQQRPLPKGHVWTLRLL